MQERGASKARRYLKEEYSVLSDDFCQAGVVSVGPLEVTRARAEYWRGIWSSGESEVLEAKRSFDDLRCRAA
eukprot:1203394-Alexandrium_andersonii.AAC.1